LWRFSSLLLCSLFFLLPSAEHRGGYQLSS
jgi:hypothetical protein